MIIPSKVIEYKESVISEIPNIIPFIINKPMKLTNLYDQFTLKYPMIDVIDFLYLIDVLYLLDRINIDMNTLEVHYVKRNQ